MTQQPDPEAVEKRQAQPNPPAASMPELREARFEDYQDIVELEASQGLKRRSFEQWSRLWRGNPVYEQLKDSWPIGWVLEDADQGVVGTLGNIPYQYWFRGREVRVAGGRAWAVKPEYRVFALMLMEQYFSQENVDLVLDTTVNDQAAGTFTVFGSQPVPTGDWSQAAYWITNYSGFVRAALRIRKAPLPGLAWLPASLGLWARDRFRSDALPPAPTGFRVEQLKTFDERFDSFWESLKAQATTLLATRDRATLAWHFGGALQEGRATIFAIHDSQGMAGYAVFRRQDVEEYGLKRLRLADFQTIRNHENCQLAMLRAALDQCRADGTHALERVGCNLANTRLVDRYAPHRRQLPAWAYYYAALAEPLQEELRDPAAWDPSSYDGDASL